MNSVPVHDDTPRTRGSALLMDPQLPDAISGRVRLRSALPDVLPCDGLRVRHWMANIRHEECQAVFQAERDEQRGIDEAERQMDRAFPGGEEIDLVTFEDVMGASAA